MGIPRKDRSLDMAKKPEDTTALSSYEELQHRNIQKRKELFRQMGFDKLKDELAAKTRTPNKPKKKRPLPPSKQSSRHPDTLTRRIGFYSSLERVHSTTLSRQFISNGGNHHLVEHSCPTKGVDRQKATQKC